MNTPEIDVLESGEEQLKMPIEDEKPLGNARQMVGGLKARVADIADTAKLEARRAVTKVAPKTDPLVWNPLNKYDRNNPCLCESGKKWKKCCGPLQPRLIPKSEAIDILKAFNKLNQAMDRVREIESRKRS